MAAKADTASTAGPSGVPSWKSGAAWAFIGAVGGVAAILFSRTLPPYPGNPAGYGPPAELNPNAVTPTGVGTASGLTAPGTPTELQELGATAHSVIVSNAPVVGATGYQWLLAGTNLPLAYSPTNVAVIEGLQADTAYDVVVRAISVTGVKSAPSGPLLIKTTQAGPQIYLPAGSPTVKVVVRLLQQGSGGLPTPPPAPPTAYPVAFEVADVADYSIARAAGVPVGALYYVGDDPYAALAASNPDAEYAPASFLPTYTGGFGQPAQTVVVGLAGQVRQGSLATLEGQTRNDTAYLLKLFIDSNPWTIQPTGGS